MTSKRYLSKWKCSNRKNFDYIFYLVKYNKYKCKTITIHNASKDCLISGGGKLDDFDVHGVCNDSFSNSCGCAELVYAEKK